MTKDKKSKEQHSAKHKNELHIAQEQIAELKDAVLRERADAMNVRKRAEDEKLKLGSFYKSLIVKELLPVIDNFERSIRSIPKELKNNDYIKGIQSIAKQFEQVLIKLGVEKIKTVGEHFDPELHEAIIMEEGDKEHEIISEEIQSGYKIDNNILRHAKVKVSKK
jgi:molecular chaperone GrpE